MAFQNIYQRWFWRWPTKDQEGKFEQEDQQDLPAIMEKRKEIERWKMNHPNLDPNDVNCDFDNIG